LGRPRSISASSGADRAAGEEHVVDEHDGLVLDRERDVGGPHDRRATQVEVIPVERDVERADGQRRPVDRRDLGGQSLGEGDPPRAEPDEGHVLGAAVAFEDLVGDPGERAVEGGGIEHFGLFAQAGRAGGHHSLLTSLAGPA